MSTAQTRPARPPAGDTALIEDPPPAGPEDAAGSSGITGLSGLSELMQQEPTPRLKGTRAGKAAEVGGGPGSEPLGQAKAAARSIPEVTPPELDEPAASTRAARFAENRDAQRKARRTIFALIALVGLCAGILGLVIMLLAGGWDAPADPETAAGSPGQRPSPAPVDAARGAGESAENP